jgi:hypothetical protein
VFLLIEGDKVVPYPLGGTVLHTLYAVGLLRSRSLLILYYVAVQLLVKGLLRFILGLKVRKGRPFCLLLATLGSG